MTDSANAYESLLALCQDRHCQREFSSRPLSLELIEKIRAVALTSPYASGKKNWEILSVTDRALIQSMASAVQERAQTIQQQLPPQYQADFTTYAHNFSAFAEAPALLIPAFRIAPTLSLMYGGEAQAIAQWERDNCVKSISCVAMLILLAAQSLGLAACYMTGPLLAEPALAELIHARRGRSLAAIIPVGYPKQGE